MLFNIVHGRSLHVAMELCNTGPWNATSEVKPINVLGHNEFHLNFLVFGTKWFTAMTTWELCIWYLFCLNKFCQSHVGEGGFGLNIIIGYFHFGFDPSLIFLTSSQDTFMLGFSPFFSRVHTPLGPLKHNVKLRRSSTSQIGVGRPKFDLKSGMPAEVEMPAPV